mmetsp:Transcript_41890/g.87478  ORF Transcript_41890/g.87478 Transcript_41890/m.87478 type:complete len:104 (-) Transcript_41890:560-871(-)
MLVVVITVALIAAGQSWEPALDVRLQTSKTMSRAAKSKTAKPGESARSESLPSLAAGMHAKVQQTTQRKDMADVVSSIGVADLDLRALMNMQPRETPDSRART